MRHAPPGAQLLAREHGAEDLVGMQAALHQAEHLAADRHGGRVFRCGVAVGYMDDLHAPEVQARFVGHRPDLGFRTHQDRHHQAQLGRVQCARERAFVAGVHHGARDCGQVFTQRQQVFEPGLRVQQLDARQAAALPHHFLRGRPHAGHPADHPFTLLIDHLTRQIDRLVHLVFGGHGRADRERVTNAHRAGKVQALIQVNGAGAWKLGAEQCRDQRAAPHAVPDHTVHQRVTGVVGIEVGGIGVTGDCCERLDVLWHQRAQQAGTLPDLQFVKSEVLNEIGDGVHGTVQKNKTKG